MRWLIPVALLGAASCTPWWSDKSRQVSAAAAATSEAAKAAGDLAQLAQDIPIAIDKCRQIARRAGATSTIVQTAYATADAADRVSRAAALVAKASENCAPPTADTLRLCSVLAGEMAQACATTEADSTPVTAAASNPAVAASSAVAVPTSTPVAVAASPTPLGADPPPIQTAPTPIATTIAALVEYNLSRGEAESCGAIAIAALAMRRMQADETRLAVEYPRSVTEQYLATLTKQATGHETQLTECRKRYRSQFQMAPTGGR